MAPGISMELIKECRFSGTACAYIPSVVMKAGFHLKRLITLQEVTFEPLSLNILGRQISHTLHIHLTREIYVLVPPVMRPPPPKTHVTVINRIHHTLPSFMVFLPWPILLFDIA